MARSVYLEGFAGRGRPPKRFDLVSFPAEIGRHPDCAIQLNVARVSRRHASIERMRNGLVIRDLGSTNGTFVNGERIDAPTPMGHGDVVHIGDQEFRLIEDEAEDGPAPDEATRVGIAALPHDFPTRVREFNELLDKEMVCAFHQPIVHADGRPFAHELLGRAVHPAFEAAPGPMFMLAEAIGEQVRLSELFRRRSFLEAETRGLDTPLFFNTHPEECRDPDRLLDGSQLVN